MSYKKNLWSISVDLLALPSYKGIIHVYNCKLVYQLYNSTVGKLGRKLDKETRRNFFPTLNQNKTIT